MAGGGEHAHVDTDLGDDALGGPFADPGDGVEMVAGLNERGDHLVDAFVEFGDRGFEMGGVIQAQSDEQRVMVPEPAA